MLHREKIAFSVCTLLLHGSLLYMHTLVIFIFACLTVIRMPFMFSWFTAIEIVMFAYATVIKTIGRFNGSLSKGSFVVVCFWHTSQS